MAYDSESNARLINQYSRNLAGRGSARGNHIANRTVGIGTTVDVVMRSIHARPGDTLRVATTARLDYCWDADPATTPHEILAGASTEFIEVPPSATTLRLRVPAGDPAAAQISVSRVNPEKPAV